MKLPLVQAVLLALCLSNQHGCSLAFSPRALRLIDTTPMRQRTNNAGYAARATGTTLVVVCAKQRAPAHHEKWQPYFDRLEKFQQEHGDCNVTDKEGDLGEWLQDQRKQYSLLKQGKKVRLTKKRAMALERLGAFASMDNSAGADWKKPLP